MAEEPDLKAVLAVLGEIKDHLGRQDQAIAQGTRDAERLFAAFTQFQGYVRRRFDDSDQRGDRILGELRQLEAAMRTALAVHREDVIKGVTEVVRAMDSTTRERLGVIEHTLGELTARQRPH